MRTVKTKRQMGRIKPLVAPKATYDAEAGPIVSIVPWDYRGVMLDGHAYLLDYNKRTRLLTGAYDLTLMGLGESTPQKALEKMEEIEYVYREYHVPHGDGAWSALLRHCGRNRPRDAVGLAPREENRAKGRE